MSLLIIIGIIWGICKLISAASARAKERARQAEIERIRREQERVREEQRRQREEMKRVAALEREQARQAKEQERLAKEQERQAAQLAKHEEQIAKLAFRMSEAERTIAHYEPQLEELKEQARTLDNKVWWYTQNGLPCEGMKEKLVKVNEKVFRMETKLNKAHMDKAYCESKLEVA